MSIDIKKMVDRFLGWKLPMDFAPDGGISFKPPVNPEWWPVGTHLLNAEQAKAMFEHALADASAAPVSAGLSEKEVVGLAIKHRLRYPTNRALMDFARALTSRLPPDWVAVKDRLPPFGEDLRVLIYTEGSDFAGEQFFDVKADHLNDAYWEDENDMPKVCKHATHWKLLPYPAIAAAPSEVQAKPRQEG